MEKDLAEKDTSELERIAEHLISGEAKKRQQIHERIQQLESELQTNPKDTEKAVELSKLYCLIHKPDNAAHHLSEVLKVEPDCLEACELLAKINFNLGRYDEALQLYQRTCELDPKNIEALQECGILMARTGKEGLLKGIDYLERALEINSRTSKDPDFARETSSSLFQMCAKAGRYNEMVEYLRNAINLHQPLLDFKLSVDTVTQELTLDRAIREVERASEAVPRDPVVGLMLARLYFENGDYDDSFAQYISVLGLKDFRKSSLLEIVLTKEKRQLPTELDLKKLPKETTIKRMLGKTIQGAGADYLDGKEKDEAIKNLQQLKKQEIGQALFEYKSSRKKEDRYEKPLFELVQVYMKYGMTPDVISVLKNGLVRHPDNGRIRLQLGDLCMRAGNIDEAIEHFKYVVDNLKPNAIEIHKLLSHLYDGVNNFDKSEEHLKIALLHEPKDANLHFMLGVVLYRRDKRLLERHRSLSNDYSLEELYSGAVSELRKAVELKPDFTQALFTLASLYYERQEHDNAKDCLERLSTLRLQSKE